MKTNYSKLKFSKNSPEDNCDSLYRYRSTDYYYDKLILRLFPGCALINTPKVANKYLYSGGGISYSKVIVM